jgi:hypothetical protein
MDRLRKEAESEIVSIKHNVESIWENSGDKLVGPISETDHLVAFHRNWASGPKFQPLI